jgi:metallo-beta-lactamase family protein
MSEVTITFLGATETVTGSRFLVSSESSKVLVDCGMFQGVREIEKKNWDEFPVAAKTIDAMILSHAHLDHCGYLPLLVHDGFKGLIHTTFYTERLASVILHDSARLQMQGDQKPLYDTQDVDKALSQFKVQQFHKKTEIAKNTFVTFYPSGHILGSAFLVLEVEGQNILFTGDMGRDNHPLLVPPHVPDETEFSAVITESTYGDRTHDTPSDLFAEEINAAFARGGSILIPAFAVDRTEVILMALHDLMDSGKIPALPIYVDSPMALAALNYYRQAITEGAPEIRPEITAQYKDADPFDQGNLREMYTSEESMQINNLEHTSIVVSASGMATGGRVVHHLANMLPDPTNTVILVGYQGAGSRGRALLDGEKRLKIHGDWVDVKAHISSVEAFSVHADANELIKFLKSIGTVHQAMIVHGELDSRMALKARLEKELNWFVKVPKTDQILSL